MLPVSQAVQASKATVARTSDSGDGSAGPGFAALLQGMSAPAPAAPASPAAAPSAAQANAPGSAPAAPDANGDAAGASGSAASAAGAAPAGATAGKRDDGATATDDGAAASAPAAGTPARQSGTGQATGQATDSGLPRSRRGGIALAADGSAAAAAAAAAQQALALHGQHTSAGATAGSGTDDALAAGARAARGAPPGWPAATPGGRAGSTPDTAAQEPDTTLASDAPDAEAVGRAAGAGRHGDQSAANALPDRADTGTSPSTTSLGAGLSALLARQAGSLAAAGLGSDPSGGTGLATGTRLAGASAPTDASALFAQLLSGAQAAALPAQAGATMADATLAIAPALGDDRWSAALGQQALFMARNQLSSAQLTVTPPDLGPIQVTLDLNHDQANAVFVSPHEAVRQAIEASLPQLRDMFSAAGLNLSGAQVQADAGNSAWTAAGGQGRQQGQPPVPGGTGGANAQAGNAAAIATAGAPARIQRGLLDTFA